MLRAHFARPANITHPVPNQTAQIPTFSIQFTSVAVLFMHFLTRLMSSTSNHGPLAVSMLANVTAALAPIHIELVNESASHGGDATSESHFKLFVVSAFFDGKSVLERHRLVNDAVRAGASNIPVHALSISAKTSAQWAQGAAMHTTPKCAGGDGSGQRSV